MLDDPHIPELQDIYTNEEFAGSETVPPVVKLYIFFLFTFQATFRISDAALSVLLSFIAIFLKLLAEKYKAAELLQLSLVLPCTVTAARKIVNSNRDNFSKYACCPSCSSVYSWKNCTENASILEKCTYIKYPDHTQQHYRKPCGTALMKLIKTPGRNLIYHPRLVYCYKSITESLQELLLHPDFTSNCEKWRTAPKRQNVYQDVFDGQVWNDFLEPDGQPFLSLPYNYALCLNVDWFQPFKHTAHSEGAAYVTILNLPRKERYLQENVILLGIIPGPHEPKLNINSFLQPFVNELKQLWKGVAMSTRDGYSVYVRAALLCCACDIPAARKVCGFMGHGALKGCSKCMLEFPTMNFGEKAVYTNTNRAEWTPRTKTDHKVQALTYKKAKTNAEQKELEREHGVRYSVLNELAYFDPPRMCVVDPMHNLLLGTSKHMINVWKTSGILTDKDFDKIQERVNSVTTPNDMGRMPLKIASGFAGFTAEQWKNWTIYFSLYALHGILPRQHFQCWQYFVKACFFYCRRTITSTELADADKLLMEFYSQVVTLYGNDACNMNLHLHGHLHECVKDYGPVYSFWLFSFERMNGILGSYYTNSRNISIQLMRRYLESKLCLPYHWPAEFKDIFLPLLENHKYQKGSLQPTSFESSIQEQSLMVSELPPIQERAFNPTELTTIKNLVQIMHPNESYDVLILHKRCKALSFNEHVIGAEGSQQSNSSLVLATLKKDNDATVLCAIQYFAECKLVNSRSQKSFWIAAISEFMEHQCKVWFGKPTQVWCTAPKSTGVEYIPISFIRSRVVFTKTKFNFGQHIGEDSVYIIVPIEHK